MIYQLKSYNIIVILLTITLNINNDKLIYGCPSDVCICKWKGGKQTVECGGQLLAKIPEGMDPGTQVLNFSGNSLQVLQSERFLRMDLINLQKIYMSRNQLIKIHEKSFRGLSNLVELDLSDNMLQQVPTETFQDYTSLMRLTLSGNPIRELKTNAFRHLAFLTTLELSNCQIEKIENEAFIGMDNLEWLRLDGNRLRSIQGSHILPKSLHGINLQSNRWTCDCLLTDVHSWLINYNIPQTEEPKCIEPPRLKGQVIKSLKKDELACLPEITPESSYTELAEGRNISLMCTVRAIPEATVLWLFNGQVLTNDSILENLHMYYYIDESGGEEKKSEVFIYNVGAEDNGTFSCIARNIAGTTFTNYTIRVIVKEPPVVKEVSFPKDYMNIIIASGGGIGLILIILTCTIVIKCRKSKPKNKNTKSDSSSNETGLFKCPSIINEEDLTPKTTKENGVVISSGPVKQNFMMYVATMPQGHIIDNGNMQLNATAATTQSINASASNIGVNLSSQYCSPQSSTRNYQDKNPDLINDTESGKNKLKSDTEYENSDCTTGPCSNTGNYESCYQLPNQFGSQIIGSSQSQPRFAMSTMPRGLHTKPNGQHQVDVHLNPVCFLGQDGYAYDFSNNHIHNTTSSQPNFYRTLPHNRGHNKLHTTQSAQLGAGSAANPGIRYSLEAEFLQRTATPPYDKYSAPNMRFTVDGYPTHPIQYPSPPEGYKGEYSLPDSVNAGQTICSSNSFQQWPPCLPGYHAQPIRYPTTVVPSQMIPMQQQQQQQQQQNATIIIGTPSSGGNSCGTNIGSGIIVPSSSSTTLSLSSSSSLLSNNNHHTQTATTSTSTLTTDIKRRCVGAQTSELDPNTIPECDEDHETSKLRHLSGPLADSPDEGYVGDSHENSDI